VTDRKPTISTGKRPGRPKLQERYDLKRLEVISVAARVFAARGYHATSIDDLVEATGIKRGGLYHYITGKQDLLVAIHERFIEPLLIEARGVAAERLPADQAVQKLAHVLMNVIAEYRNEVTVFLHEWRAIEPGPAWERVQSARREFERIVHDVLVQGDREGALKLDDAPLAVYAFLGMINYTYQWYDPSGRRSADEIAEYFSSIFLDGVRSRGR
jgi:AcrR family transcriptional regulator